MVEWSPEASEELAEITVEAYLAGQAARVARAQHIIDLILEHDPESNGRHMSEGLYRIDLIPLSARFSIDHDACQVLIDSVGLLR